MTERPSSADPPAAAARNGWRTFGIVIITVLATAAVSYWLLSSYVFRTSFVPVRLEAGEQRRLEAKLERVQQVAGSASRPRLEPQPYSETGASREVEFTERELNALLARNTDLANKLAIDLSHNLASANLLVDLDPDFPVLGGRTLRVTAGLELGVVNGQPRAVLKGVSLWGVPLPNAWLGNMKNVDLIQEFGQAGGFWQAMRDGVEVIEVRERRLRIRLKE